MRAAEPGQHLPQPSWERAKLHNTARRWYHRSDELASRPPLGLRPGEPVHHVLGHEFCVGPAVPRQHRAIYPDRGTFTVAGVVFTALLLRRPAAERVPGRQWPLLLGMGVTGVFGFGSLLYTGLRTTTATNASLINGTSPLVIGILAALTCTNTSAAGRRSAR